MSIVNGEVHLQQFYLKETPTKVCSCEVCETFKDTFFYRTPPMAASVLFQCYLVWLL